MQQCRLISKSVAMYVVIILWIITVSEPRDALTSATQTYVEMTIKSSCLTLARVH
jgi:hypothetical protein